jgi:hypothetical protein
MTEATPVEWFEQRVRPLIGAALGSGTWQGAAERLEVADLQLVAASLRSRDGLPARAALTMLAGWTAGYAAWVIAIGVVRDRVLVRASAPGALRVLRHPDGYYFDAQLGRPCAAVEPDHPWAGRPDVSVVPDGAPLEAAAVREIALTCEPILEPIARASGRGRLGLWAQVADSLADAARSVSDLSAVQALLDADGAPWRQRPRMWVAGDGTLVKHRGSCCLWHRREGAEPDEGYCDNCLFRTREDVEGRVLGYARSGRVTPP